MKNKHGHGLAEARGEILKFKPGDVTIIGYDTDDGPSHPLCDPESNAEKLNESSVRFTMRHGILSPVECKRDGKRTLVNAGRGRTRLLREANERLIAEGKQPWLLPVQIVRGDETRLLERKIGENAHRRTLNPMARAREAAILCEKMPRAQVAETFGVSLTQLDNILALLDLAPAVVKVVQSGNLSPTAAAGLAKLSAAEQTEQLGHLMVNGTKPTVAETQRKVREVNGKAPLDTPKLRIERAIGVLDTLDDHASKDVLWSAIKKIRGALERGDAGKAKRT